MLQKRVVTLVSVVAVLTAAACGGGSSKNEGGGSPQQTAKVNPADCGLDAFASAKKPVEVKFWHQMAGANNDWVVNAANQFNRSQHDVHVTLTQFADYRDLLTKYLAGLSTHDLPDMFQPEDTTVQQMIDSKSVVPVQACIDADHYPLEKLLPRAIAYYSYQHVLYGMPWNISNPIIYYNANVFTKAGLDPNKPPQTLDEVKAYSQKIVASHAARYGIALRVEPYVFEFLNAKSGSTLVNNGNGRDARTTAATLNTPTALAIWTWWNDMVKNRLARNTGGAPGNIDHMVALGNGEAGMTMEASGQFGRIKQALEGGQYSNARIEGAALPSLNGDGGVPVGDGSLWLSKASPLATRAAAWQFIKYLSSAEEQASLSVESGYAPIRSDATEVPALAQKWQQEPSYRVSYDQLTTGGENTATAGSLIGDYQGVRDGIKDGMLSMLTGGLSPEAAIRKAQSEATSAIGAYNDRLGVG